MKLIVHEKWHDAAVLEIKNPRKGFLGSAKLSYDIDYGFNYQNNTSLVTCSVNNKVVPFEVYSSSVWPHFLDDMVPAGASRKYWLEALSLTHLTANEQDQYLLAKATIAPIGNMRIKEALPDKSEFTENIRFNADHVINRDSDFLEYAHEKGASAGGATGAGGEAPKLLIRSTPDNKIWIDTFQDNNLNQDIHYLVKYPRNRRSAIDCNILRAEYFYYQELEYLGFNTINCELMRLEEGRYPSLLLPRFDVGFNEKGKIERYGMESVFSVMDVRSGYLDHFQVVEKLCRCLAIGNRSFDRQYFVSEWLQRDLLNYIFGNSDNHGRNISLIKEKLLMRLAPIYDFAPMKADPEAITRTTKWGAPFEIGGNFDWPAIINKLANDMQIDASLLLIDLKKLALKLTGLKARLQKRGVPDSILSMPVMGFDYSELRLQKGGLL